MALEDFIVDLCQDSVSGALLVCRLQPVLVACLTLMRSPDILAIPNPPPRPRRKSAIRLIQDLPPHLQQGPAHCLWRRQRSQGREDT